MLYESGLNFNLGKRSNEQGANILLIVHTGPSLQERFVTINPNQDQFPGSERSTEGKKG